MRLKKRDEVNQSGMFWLPEKPEERSPGKLTIMDGGRIRLETTKYYDLAVGMNLDKKNLFWRNLPQTRTTIMGQLQTSEFVKLDGCLKYNEGSHSNQSGYTGMDAYLAQQAFIFPWNVLELLEEKDLRFNTASFQLDGLNHWLDGRHCEHIEPEDPMKFPSVEKLLFTTPLEIPLDLQNGRRLLIRQGWDRQHEMRRVVVSRSLRSYFRLEAQEPFSIGDFMEEAEGLRDFLTVAAGQCVSLVGHVSLTTENLKACIPGHSEEPLPIKYFRPSVSYPYQELFSPEWLFSYQKIADKPGERISSFLKKRRKAKHAFEIYRRALTDLVPFPREKFLALVRGIEVLDAVLGDKQDGKSPQPKKEAPDLLACPWDLKKETRLQKEPEFNQRLRALLQYFPHGASPFKFPKEEFEYFENKKSFINRVRRLRNQITHPAEVGPSTTDLPLLPAFNMTLEVLYQLTFLRFCGFTGEEICSFCQIDNTLPFPPPPHKVASQAEASSKKIKVSNRKYLLDSLVELGRKQEPDDIKAELGEVFQCFRILEIPPLLTKEEQKTWPQWLSDAYQVAMCEWRAAAE